MDFDRRTFLAGAGWLGTGLVAGVNLEEFLASGQSPKFEPAFNGAVPRSLSDKLAEAPSVRDFGAVGDGKKDDTRAIERALRSTKALYFPPGEYFVSERIDAPRDDFSLIGAGASSVIVRAPEKGIFFPLWLSERSDVELLNLRFVADPRTLTDVMEGGFVAARDMDRLLINGCRFEGFNAQQQPTMFSFVRIGNSTDVVITDCFFSGAFGNMIGPEALGGTIPERGERVVVANCVFDRFSDTGIGIWTHGGRSVIHGNLIRGYRKGDVGYRPDYPGVGIDVAGSKDVIISSNVIIGSTYGIRVAGNLIFSDESVLITDNQILDQHVLPGNTRGDTTTAIRIIQTGVENRKYVRVLNNMIRAVTEVANGWHGAIQVIASRTASDPTAAIIQIDGNAFLAEGKDNACVNLNCQNGPLTLLPGQNVYVLKNGAKAAIGRPAGAVTSNCAYVVAERENLRVQGSGTRLVLASLKLSPGIYAIEVRYGDISGPPMNAEFFGTGFAVRSDSSGQVVQYIVASDGGYGELAVQAAATGNAIDVRNLTIWRLM